MPSFDDASLEITLSANRSQDFAIRMVPKSDTGASPAALGRRSAGRATTVREARPRTVQGSRDLALGDAWSPAGVALGGALTFELLRRSSESAAEKEDTQIGYQEKLDQMESRQTTARILAGVGGRPRHRGRRAHRRRISSSSKSSKAASLAVTPTPGGLFVSARGAY
jgi:hypothetical protein